MNKEILRKIYREKRDNLSDSKEKSKQIITNFLNLKEFKEAKVIALYYPLKSEVDISSLLNICLKKSKQVSYPKIIDKHNITFYQVSNFNDLKIGTFSIYEPEKRFLVLKDKIDIMLIPGLCFDLSFNRLGYGKGYYDKYLKDTNIIKVGICFEKQISKELIDTNDHDIKMDYLITENKIYKKPKN